MKMLARMNDCKNATAERYEKALRPRDRRIGTYQSEKRIAYTPDLPNNRAEIPIASASLEKTIRRKGSPAVLASDSVATVQRPIDLSSDVEKDDNSGQNGGETFEELKLKSSTFSPSTFANKQRPSYESKLAHIPGSESGEDLPEFGSLLGQSANPRTFETAKVGGTARGVCRRRKARKYVVEDDSDEA